MIFSTNRCIIRKFEEKDIDDFMFYRNNPEWMQYQGFKGLTKQEYRLSLLENFNLNEGVQLAIINIINDKLIGDLYLKKEKADFWIGYTINPQFSRQGFAFEAVNGLVDWIRGKGAEKINADVSPENTASISLLKKLGFVYVGINEYGDELYELNLKQNCF